MIKHLETIKDNGVIPLLKIANGFKIQLQQLSEDNILAENNDAINERFIKAVDYFIKQTEEFIKKPLSGISFSTDNKAVQKDLEKQIYTLQDLLSVKLFCFLKLKKGFQVEDYLQVRANAVLQNVEKPKKKKINSSRDPILALSLRELRDGIHKKENIPHFQIFTQKTLYAICDALPKTAQELLKVDGMGKIRVQKYGGRILDAVNFYCKEQGIKQQSKEKEKEDKIPTREVSFKLFKQGLSVKEISKEKKFNSRNY